MTWDNCYELPITHPNSSFGYVEHSIFAASNLLASFFLLCEIAVKHNKKLYSSDFSFRFFFYLDGKIIFVECVCDSQSSSVNVWFCSFRFSKISSSTIRLVSAMPIGKRTAAPRLLCHIPFRSDRLHVTWITALSTKAVKDENVWSRQQNR